MRVASTWMPPDTNGPMIIGGGEPTPDREPPSLSVLAGIVIVLLLAGLTVGAVGDQPATGDQLADSAEAAVASTATTAVTTTTLGAAVADETETTVGPRFVTESDLVASLLTSEIIELPPGLGAISHLAEARGVAYAFAPATEGERGDLGLRVASWHEGWGSVVDVAPTTDAVVAVAGHDLGLVALTQPADSVGVPFGQPLVRNLSLWTSVDGLTWTRSEITPPLGTDDMVFGHLAVSRRAAFIFAKDPGLDPDTVVDALPADLAQMVRGAGLHIERRGEQVVLLAGGTPTELIALTLAELGVAQPVSTDESWVRLATSDFGSWSAEPSPPLASVSVGTDGAVLGSGSDSTVWRLDRRRDPEILIAPNAIGAPLFATTSELGIYGVSAHPAGAVIALDATDTRTELRFAGCCHPLPPHPVSSSLGVLFNSSVWDGPAVDEVVVASTPGGGRIVASIERGSYEVHDAQGRVAASASLWGDDESVVFERALEAIAILDGEGEVAGRIELGDLTALGTMYDWQADRPGVLYTDGADWQRVDLPDRPTAMLPIDDGFLVSTDDLNSPLVYLRVWAASAR